MRFLLKRYPNDESPTPILIPRRNISWEAKAVFNPSVVYDDGIFRMLYRTYPSILEETTPRLKRPGFHFKNQISYIGYAESKDGIHFECKDNPFISPDAAFDKYGCEDPRMTKIGDTFYITYTAIGGPLDNKIHRPNVRIALATTEDFHEVKKLGMIGPPTNSKAASLFPELVNGGRVGMLMTIAPDSTASRVSMRYYDSIEAILHSIPEEWTDFLAHDNVTLETAWWLHRGPELGAVPIKTERGWLLIFSAEAMADVWTVSAALLDIDEPHKLIARTPGYLLQPVADYERDGLVPNVTFPSGAVVVGDELYVYYGAADTVIGLATCKLDELLDYVELYKNKPVA